MVAAPTFMVRLGDPLTGDHVRSDRDSRLVSSRGPLWFLYGPSTAPHVGELVADGMGMIIRTASLSFLRTDPREIPLDVGGTSQHIWLVTQQGQRSFGPNPLRIYDLSPHDFSVRRQRIITDHDFIFGVDGDDETIYVGIWTQEAIIPAEPRGHLWQLNARDLSLRRSRALGDTLPLYLAGDSERCWVRWRHWIPYQTGLKEYTSALGFVRDIPFPLIDQGHTPGALGGGSTRIYYNTRVLEGDATLEWPEGRYLHTIEPSSFSVIRTYGPMVSDKGPGSIGGK